MEIGRHVSGEITKRVENGFPWGVGGWRRKECSKGLFFI